MDSEQALQLRGRGKAEVQTLGSWESGGTNSRSQESGDRNSDVPEKRNNLVRKGEAIIHYADNMVADILTKPLIQEQH
ncbi:hypothetical protein PAXRUDRAFT_22079 [Paxillus rubicundulus Ve08.2h10]|uniref:Uncharacterized protein n=1 Tax=Paxillus rubicundulus Ve08.2h10 TaxID=930991 RepID=A0A0D0D666_9AGAM|nr:hypothetical protein PAXRUDRAFT_22079 [Paxillus rubicundulus Ve08.2h10]